MGFAKPINANASATNHLKLTEGEGLCCPDQTKSDYTVTVDTDGTTVVAVNVTDGATTSTVALAGAPINWALAANNLALKDAIEKVATDKGYIAREGGIEFSRDGTDLTITIKDSTLVWNWIGTATSDENDFTATVVE